MNLKQAIQNALSKFEPKETLYSAFLGKADGTLRVTGKSGWMYCRMWNGEVVEAYNLGGVPAAPGLAVNLAFRQRRFHILPKDVYKDLVRTGIPDGIEEELQYPGAHTLYVRGEQFLPGLVYPKSNLLLSIGGGVIPLDAGGYIQVFPAEVDMSAHLPVSGAIWATIELTQAGSVTVTTGGAKPAMNELDEADIPTTDGAYPLAAVRLRFGQVNIMWGKYKNDIVDLRWFRKGAGAPAGSDTEIQFNDGGAFGADSELTFNKTTKVLKLGSPASSVGDEANFIQSSDSVSVGHLLETIGAAITSYVTGIRGRGTTDAPAAVLADDILLKLRGRAYDGAGSLAGTSAAIYLVANEDYDSGSHGARIEIWTTPSGSTTLTLAATIRSDGNMDIASGKKYYVNGAQHTHDASDISNAPTGNIAATDVQTAINELDAEKQAINGWIPINESWTYDSASTIAVPSNATERFSKGVKIRFTQGGVDKYFVAYPTSTTRLTVLVNTDYTVANSAITNIYISYDNPRDFPEYFSYAPAISAQGGGFAIGNGTITGAYACIGRTTIQVKIQVSGGSTTNWGTGYINFGIPISPVSDIESGTGNILHSGTRYALSSYLRTSDMRTIYGNNIVGQGTPVTLGSGSSIYISVLYQW